MNASQSVGMPRQEASVPSGLNHSTRQDFSNQREPVRPNAKVSPTLENLTASNDSNQCEHRNREVMVIQGITSPETKDSMPSVGNVTDCSKSEKAAGFRDTNMKSQARKNGGHHSIFNEDQFDVLSLAICGKGKRKKRKIWEQGNSSNVGSGHVKDITVEKLARTQKMHASKLISGLKTDKGKGTEDGTITDESQGMDQKDKSLSSEPPLLSRPHISSSTVRQTPSISLSENISLTSLISRYFSDYDEVNSCSSLTKNIQNTKKLTQQFNDVLKVEKIQQNEITGHANYAAEFSVNQKSSKRIALDSDTICSFKVSSDGVKWLEDYPMNISNRELYKNEIVAFDRERQTKSISGKMKDNHEKTFRNEFSRGKLPVDKQKVCVTPHCSSMNSTPLSFNKHMGASRSKFGRNEVGKRLVQAANNIWFSVSGKKSLQSMLVSRSGNLSVPESVVPVKKLPFEIDDSDD
ncbi:putative Structural maintenance of chromosomes protein 6 [Cocos nucifera]|uniref:Putative Structural maintenance of chromosomes protein 6 n=1 Tax=Cocos nucifera TaxID=13894 RepID=A0A8K0MUJ3_COCNU|nr:putative Structural maintenance of chromosomes protein 6 [Cocos nucifera]